MDRLGWFVVEEARIRGETVRCLRGWVHEDFAKRIIDEYTTELNTNSNFVEFYIRVQDVL